MFYSPQFETNIKSALQGEYQASPEDKQGDLKWKVTELHSNIFMPVQVQLSQCTPRKHKGKQS
jgi:hypothetical protein